MTADDPKIWLGGLQFPSCFSSLVFQTFFRRVYFLRCCPLVTCISSTFVQCYRLPCYRRECAALRCRKMAGGVRARLSADNRRLLTPQPAAFSRLIWTFHPISHISTESCNFINSLFISILLFLSDSSISHFIYSRASASLLLFVVDVVDPPFCPLHDPPR